MLVVLEAPDGQIIVARTNEAVAEGRGYRLDLWGILVPDDTARYPAKVRREGGRDVDRSILFAWS